MLRSSAPEPPTGGPPRTPVPPVPAIAVHHAAANALPRQENPVPPAAEASFPADGGGRRRFSGWWALAGWELLPSSPYRVFFFHLSIVEKEQPVLKQYGPIILKSLFFPKRSRTNELGRCQKKNGRGRGRDRRSRKETSSSLAFLLSAI